MKKFLLCLSLLMVLCGCYQASDLETEIDRTIVGLQNVNINNYQNHVKRFYRYYLPSDVVSIESGSTYDVFSCEQTTFVMNLDVGRIINDEYYHENEISENISIYAKDYLVYDLNGTVLDSVFKLNVYQCDQLYLLELAINNVTFNACVKLDYVSETLRKMLIIGNSVLTNNNEIIDNLSNKDVIEFHKEKIDLFQIIIPKDGRLEELINPKLNIGFEKDDSKDIDDNLDEEQ